MRRVLCFLLISFTCLTSTFSSDLSLDMVVKDKDSRQTLKARPLLNMVRYRQPLPLTSEIVAICYEKGSFFFKYTKNQEAALSYFSQGAAYGHAGSQFGKALLHIKRDERTEAFVFMRKAAINGHIKAIHNVGVCWETGFGTPADLIIAEYCYREAARRGYAPAQNKCRKMAYGAATKGNHKKAFILFKAAAIGRDPQAMFAMAVMYEHSLSYPLSDKDKKAHNEKIKFWYKKAAAANYVPAIHELGAILYRNGEFEQAIKYFRRSGSQGFLPSIQNLGLILYVNQYYQEALPYLEKAENAEHLYHAGMIYKGELPGTEKFKDLEKAEHYFILAKGQGLKEAEDALAQLPTVKKKPGSNKKKSELIKRRQGKPRALAFSEE